MPLETSLLGQKRKFPPWKFQKNLWNYMTFGQLGARQVSDDQTEHTLVMFEPTSGIHASGRRYMILCKDPEALWSGEMGTLTLGCET